MKRLLLIDDDPFLLRVYRDGLTRHGFDVHTIQDGLEAIKTIRVIKPDLVILDLMMPKFSGTEVLNFMRSQPDLAELPVIVLSNAYMDALAKDAAIKGAQKGLLKVRCTPAALAAAVKELLDGVNSRDDTSVLLAAPGPDGRVAPKAKPASAAIPDTTTEPPHRPGALPSLPEISDAQVKAEARQAFLRQANTHGKTLRGLFDAFRQARNKGEQRLHLENFYRRVHFLAAEAGLADCYRVAALATALEALLLQLLDTPTHITPSVLRTLARSLEFLAALLQKAAEPDSANLPHPEILMVDDDPLSTRLVVSALRQIQFRAISVDNPAKALAQVQEKQFDVVLMDVELPGMNGFELCRQMRSFPGYETTPVIYVTSHSDFEHRARSLDVGAVDLIAKPVLPMELAVKVVMHLLTASLRATRC
jgi:DNA-binding response OmpR family regulator